MHGKQKNAEGLQWFAGAESPDTSHKVCFGEEGVVEAHCFSRKLNCCLWEKRISLDFNSSTKGVYDPAQL